MLLFNEKYIDLYGTCALQLIYSSLMDLYKIEEKSLTQEESIIIISNRNIFQYVFRTKFIENQIFHCVVLKNKTSVILIHWKTKIRA